MRSFSVYFHIPYCLHKCPYCDFNSYALTSIPEKEYVSALLAEIDYYGSLAEWRWRPVETVYFGGGTPSLFSPESINSLLGGIRSRFELGVNAEITLEANPGTVTPESLKGYRDAGVNRLSIGAQTTEPNLLKKLGRIHSVEQTEAAVAHAREAGFENLSLDLIYGIPGQTMGELRADLKRLLTFGPRHISAYGLTIEKGTPFYLDFKRKRLALPPEEAVLEMMAEINSFLPSCGYKRYEVSNYAERGFEALHNLRYWHGEDYLGVGAGAHSLLTGYEGEKRIQAERWANFALPAKYMKQAIAYGQARGWQESLGVPELMFEFFFLGLRKARGVSLKEFEERFGAQVTALYPGSLQILTEEALVKIEDDMLHLTDRGFELADSVIENFVQPETLKAAEKTPA